MKELAISILVSAWLAFFAFTAYKEMWGILAIGTLATFGFICTFESGEKES